MREYTQEEAHALFARVARGEMSEDELAKLLMDLKNKGETPAEIAGAAAAFLEAASPFVHSEPELADCVGTGGDGFGTLNVSTAAMFVVAEMGLKVAKHGNAAVSSKCGSADVLTKAGVKIDMTPDAAKRCLDALGVTFLYAPKYHPGMRNAAAVRKALGVRTIFNILGPLINPARPKIQLSGVYSESLVRPYAETLLRLGVEKGMVVHGSGLDEVAVHGPTTACLIRDGVLVDLTIDPNEVGVGTYELDAVLGGDSEMNCEAMLSLLAGKGSDAYTALVAINAGALYWTAAKCDNAVQGTQLAMDVIKSGSALQRLRRFVEMSHHD